VLKVISRSTFDLQAVHDTLAESAARLSEADIAVIRRRERDTSPLAATYGVSPQQRADLEHHSPNLDRGALFGPTLIGGRPVHATELVADREHDRPLTAARAAVGVPLLREGTVVGVLIVMRQEPRAFSKKQIELIETFADQAVIAIENVRLFDEVQVRTRELSETLEQQTATAGILSVISNSLDNTQPVFDAIVDSGLRLFPGATAIIILPHG